MQSGARREDLINELSRLRRFELQSRTMNLKADYAELTDSGISKKICGG
jgi:hypothetical protein